MELAMNMWDFEGFQVSKSCEWKTTLLCQDLFDNKITSMQNFKWQQQLRPLGIPIALTIFNCRFSDLCTWCH